MTTLHLLIIMLPCSCAITSLWMFIFGLVFWLYSKFKKKSLRPTFEWEICGLGLMAVGFAALFFIIAPIKATPFVSLGIVLIIPGMFLSGFFDAIREPKKLYNTAKKMLWIITEYRRQP